MTRRSYSGNAPVTTLSQQVSAADVQLKVADPSGYPTGIAGPFFIAIDVGKASEEKVLCASRTADVLYVTTRGADGTTAQTHATGASVHHVWTATDADEANAHVNATSDVHGVAGDFETAIEGIASGAGADAVAAHEAAADPHAQYQTKAENDVLYLPLAGGTVTGPIIVPDASAQTHAMNETAAATRFLRLTGGTVTGATTFTGAVTVPAPTAAQNPATFKWVNDKLAVGPVASAPAYSAGLEGTFFLAY